MKSIYRIILLLLLPYIGWSQSQDENYVRTTTYLNPVQENDVDNPENKVIKTISYYDGLGRLMQTRAIKAGANEEDLVMPVVYDFAGRQVKNYLPHPNTGPFGSSENYFGNDGVISAQASYYQTKFADDFNGTVNPYTETQFEASPLNRPLKQAAPGSDWAIAATGDDHSIKMGYLVNVANEVMLFNVTYSLNPDGTTNYLTPTLGYSGYYPEASLIKDVIKSENWKASDGKANTVEEFRNKTGQVLLRRTYTKESGQDVAHDTYYIYDDFGQLSFVLSPKASDAILITPANTIDTQVLGNLGYQYIYDHRSRLIEKKIPGKQGSEAIVYDYLDRPILTQDPNLRAQGKWLFTKYDKFGRAVYTGIYSSTDTRLQLQTNVDAIATGYNESRIASPINHTDIDVYYSNDVFPTTNIEILTVNYYDDYNFGNPDVLQASGEVTLSSYMSQSGNLIAKSTNTTAWNAGFITNKKITGDGYIEFTALHANKRQMIGLSSDNNLSNHNYTTIDYAIDIGYDLDDYVRIYENGTGIGTGITFVPSDIFRVERVGNIVQYKKNGEIFYQSTVTSSGDLTGDSSFLNYGAEITNLKLVNTAKGQEVTLNTKGLPTGSVVRILDTDKFTHTITQYDEKGRPLYLASKNEYQNTHDVIVNTYDFSGNLLEVITSHAKSGVSLGSVSTVVTKDILTYDHQNRLLRHTQTIDNNDPEILVENHYDELGQLIQKKTGVSTHKTSTVLTNLYRVAQEGNTISKVVTDAWDGNFETQEQIPADKDGAVEYTITERGKYNMIGLSDPSGTLDNGYTTIDYAIYTGTGANGDVVAIREEGVNKAIPYLTFQPGDTFKVERIIDPNTNVGEVKYYKNGISFYTSTIASNTALIGDASLGKRGSYVKNFKLTVLNPNAGQSLQTEDYTYNVRGWLKQINDPSQSLTNDVFAFKINYNTTETGLGAAALYNGNISETIWKTASDNEQRAYGYTFDALNRVTGATYAAGNTYANELNFFNLNSISYDKNGNILSLHRNSANANHSAAISMDNLVYGYADNSNLLTRVTDTTVNPEGFNDNYQNSGSDPADNDYLYDDNGNMIVDKNKHITSIEYNYLNLPTKVTFSNQTGGSTANTIEYVYDATGIKQEKLVTTYFSSNSQEKATLYAGNYIYEKENISGTVNSLYKLAYFSHPEGYTELRTSGSGLGTTTSFEYVYQIKDHLGNIRVSYTDYDHDGVVDIARTEGPNEMLLDIDGDGDFESDIIQAKNYYPFGLQIQHGAGNPLSIINGRNHKYGYNGMEREDGLNYNMDEMDVRHYDVALARWVVLDPVTHHNYSPYQAFDNNPVFWADPSGADSMTIQNGQGIIGGITLGNESGGNNNHGIGGIAGAWTHIGNGNYKNSETGEVTNDWQKAIYETSNYYQETGPEKTFSVAEYIKLWEKEHGVKMTDEQKMTLFNGCIGITALELGANIEKGQAPNYEWSYATLALAKKVATVLSNDIKNNPDSYLENSRVVIFSMRFWSKDPADYRPDPNTGLIDMSEYLYEARSDGYYNFDFGLYDKKDNLWWHANHSQPGMEVYKSSLRYFSRPLNDFNRQIFCVAITTVPIK